MKNLSLFIVLCCLIGFAYYSDEIVKVNKQREKLTGVRLFSEFNKFNEFHTKNYILEKKEDWRVRSLNYPASKKLVSTFIKILGGIHKVEELSLEEDTQYFDKNSSTFSFIVNGIETEYTLGNVSELTGRFYVKKVGVESKVYICKDISAFSGTYQTDLDLNIKKYLRLKSFLVGQKDLFIERRLFNSLPIDKIQSVSINNRHNRPFELNIEQNITTPNKFEELEYPNLRNTLQQYFETTFIKSIVSQGKNILSNPVSTLNFVTEGKKIKVVLYAGLNGNYGHYAKFKDLGIIFEIDEDSKQIFHTHVQDFWIKRFPLNINFKKISHFNFKLGLSQNNLYLFSVTDIKNFKVKIKSKEVLSYNTNLVNFVFNLLFNLAHFQQADYLERLNSVVDMNAQLYVEMFNRQFGISILKKTIEVTDITSKLKYYFKYSTEHLREDTLERIFTLKEK